MRWAEFARKPGAALDRVEKGEEITINRAGSMWRLRLRAPRKGEAETSARDVWTVSQVRTWAGLVWSEVRTAPVLISRRGVVVAILEVMP